MYISSVSLPISEPYQTHLIILCGYDNAYLFYVGMISLHFLSVGECLICLIVLVVKLLTGINFGLHVKDSALAVLSFSKEPPLLQV